MAKTETEDEKTAWGCAAIIAAFALTPVSWALMGLVGAAYWEWFVRPVFPALPSITYWQAIGLRFAAGILTHRDQDCKSPDRTMSETFFRLILFTFGAPAFWWASGWCLQALAHQWGPK